MRLLITGSDSPLGQLAADAFHGRHDLILVPSTGVDLRNPDEVAETMPGVEAILHLAPFPRVDPQSAVEEAEVLDRAANGTFVLLHAAKEAGVKRLVLASRLELFDAYPPNYRIDETWEPRPAPDAASLAPWMAELTVREFVRAEELLATCLRFGPIGEGTGGTTPEMALAALERALTFDPAPSLHRWWLFHVCSEGRYGTEASTKPPFSLKLTGDG